MRRRIAILTAIAAVLATAVVLIVMRTRHGTRPPVVARGDGGAALRAPHAPQLPDQGVRLTGVVVDGAGIPVAGAELTAEPEKVRWSRRGNPTGLRAAAAGSAPATASLPPLADEIPPPSERSR